MCIMKSHISASIDSEVLARVDRYRTAVRRSRSQVIELALERMMDAEAPETDEIVGSSSYFKGRFSREETYAR